MTLNSVSEHTNPRLWVVLKHHKNNAGFVTQIWIRTIFQEGLAMPISAPCVKILPNQGYSSQGILRQKAITDLIAITSPTPPPPVYKVRCSMKLYYFNHRKDHMKVRKVYC